MFHDFIGYNVAVPLFFDGKVMKGSIYLQTKPKDMYDHFEKPRNIFLKRQNLRLVRHLTQV